VEPELPEGMRGLDEKETRFVELSGRYDDFKEFLLSLV
jgi:hypothetical protein